MDKIEKIRSKIDRMLDDICEADGFVQKKDEPRYDALAEVLDFIDTLDLEEEPALKGYDEAYLNEKIAKASKTWKGVDVDKYMDEVRGREPDKSLEEEVKRYYSDNFAYISSDQPTLSILTNVARHFYELGKNSK